MTIRCSVCQYDNLDSSSYCQSCGSALSKGVSLPVQVIQQIGYELRGQDGAVYPLSRSQLQVGRQTGCDILLAESSVSGYHAMLTQQAGQWFLQDLGSSNGTRVNGVRLAPHQVTLIQPGSQLELGSWQGTLVSTNVSGAYAATQRIGGSVPALIPPSMASPAAPAPKSKKQASQLLGTLIQSLQKPFAARSSQPSLPPGAIARGIVTNALPDEVMDPPTDVSQILLKLSVWVFILGALGLLGMANWIWLAIALLPVVLLLWMLRLVGVFLMPFGMFSVFGGKKAQSQGINEPRGFHWSLADTITNQGVSGSLIRKPRQGGTLSAGDEIAVYGRINRNNLVEAYAIIVTKRAGNPLWIRLEGMRPWPIWIGLIAIATVAGGLLWFAYSLHLL